MDTTTAEMLIKDPVTIEIHRDIIVAEATIAEEVTIEAEVTAGEAEVIAEAEVMLAEVSDDRLV